MTLRILFLVPLLMITHFLWAQSLKGLVVHAGSKGPVENASVSLLNPGSGALVKGAIADSAGHFFFGDLPSGAYWLKVEGLGCKPLVKHNVVLGVGTVDLGTLTLSDDPAYLKEITINGNKPLVENQLDKVVYNVASDLTAQNGVALDVLKKVPSVSVDIDGNVELEGDANVRFLINGKPSTIFGSSLADALQTIPASQIQSIEVMTSPGAKYDASGTGGIINIILKESKVRGIHGVANVSAGTRLENGSFDLNLRQGAFSVNAFLSGNAQLSSTTPTSTQRQAYSTTLDTMNTLGQNGSTTMKRSGYQTGLSLGWDLDKRDKLTASFNYDHFSNNMAGGLSQFQGANLASGASISGLYSTLVSGSQVAEHAEDWSLDYKRTFRNKDQELDALITTSSGGNLSDYYQQQSYIDTVLSPSGSRGHNPGTDKETDVSIDYAQPLAKGFLLETGVKGSFEQIRNVVQTDTLMPDLSYQSDEGQSYGFAYDRQIYAAYVSSSFTFFHGFLEGKAGLRYEYTHTKADFAGASVPDNTIWAPSAVLTHKLDGTQTLKASYSYRIERPDYEDLNPFYNISDPHNISTGNPDLQPEVGHRIELGYSKDFSSGASLTLSAVYRFNTEDIQSFSTYYPTLVVDGTTYSEVTLTQRYNIGSQKFYGVNFFGSLNLTSKWSLRSNIQAGDRTNATPGIGTVSGLFVRGNLNTTYKFSHGWTAEAFGSYMSSQRNLQGVRPAFGFYTLAVKKTFWNKKASVGLTATNPFTEYIHQKATLSGTGFSQYTLRSVPYQSFGITLSYSFGKLEFKGKEHESDQAPAQMEGN
jgi:ferric enterobactin receptor